MNAASMKAVIWLLIALAIDFVVDPTWSAFNNSLYPGGFTNWNLGTQVLYLHVLPFAFSNSIEGIVYAGLFGRGAH